MKLFDTLLARLNVHPHRDRATRALDARIGKTIDEALASAGLARVAGREDEALGSLTAR